MITADRAQKKLKAKTSSTTKKNVAFFPNHPSQIWMLRPVAEAISDFANPVWVLRDKDCSLALGDAMGLDYVVASKAATGLIGNGIELLANIFRCFRISRRYKIDLWVTYYGCGNIAAKLLRVPSVAFNDDDADIVPLIAWTSYPFANMALVTQHTRMGRFAKKAVRYAANHELFYLHPSRFVPDKGILHKLGLDEGQPYAIIRLSALQAHHDHGIRGLSEELLRRVIDLSKNRCRLFITSEKPLSEEFEHLRLPLAPEDIMHALAFAEFFLGDSQTMTSEAAVLGTPAFRINDFVGRISYLQDLEDYGLAFGFKPGQEEELLAEMEMFLRSPHRHAAIAVGRQKFLSDMIDPVPWYAHVIKMVIEGATREDVLEWAKEEYGLC